MSVLLKLSLAVVSLVVEAVEPTAPPRPVDAAEATDTVEGNAVHEVSDTSDPPDAVPPGDPLETADPVVPLDSEGLVAGPHLERLAPSPGALLHGDLLRRARRARWVPRLSVRLSLRRSGGRRSAIAVWVWLTWTPRPQVLP